MAGRSTSVRTDCIRPLRDGAMYRIREKRPYAVALRTGDVAGYQIEIDPSGRQWTGGLNQSGSLFQSHNQ